MKQKLNLTELSKVDLANANGGAEGGKTCTCGSMEQAYGIFSIENCSCSNIFNAIGLDTVAPNE
jgi:hypothetical protein